MSFVKKKSKVLDDLNSGCEFIHNILVGGFLWMEQCREMDNFLWSEVPAKGAHNQVDVDSR